MGHRLCEDSIFVPTQYYAGAFLIIACTYFFITTVVISEEIRLMTPTILFYMNQLIKILFL